MVFVFAFLHAVVFPLGHFWGPALPPFSPLVFPISSLCSSPASTLNKWLSCLRFGFSMRRSIGSVYFPRTFHSRARRWCSFRFLVVICMANERAQKVGVGCGVCSVCFCVYIGLLGGFTGTEREISRGEEHNSIISCRHV